MFEMAYELKSQECNPLQWNSGVPGMSTHIPQSLPYQISKLNNIAIGRQVDNNGLQPLIPMNVPWPPF
jgi:hypothetical protein